MHQLSKLFSTFITIHLIRSLAPNHLFAPMAFNFMQWHIIANCARMALKLNKISNLSSTVINVLKHVQGLELLLLLVKKSQDTFVASLRQVADLNCLSFSMSTNSFIQFKFAVRCLWWRRSDSNILCSYRQGVFKTSLVRTLKHTSKLFAKSSFSPT